MSMFTHNDKHFRPSGASNLIVLVMYLVTFLLSQPPTSPASDQIPARKQQHPIAIIGATIHPVSGADIEKGTIVFQKGIITAVGVQANVPQGAEIINGSGKHVYPGLISADTYIGLIEIGAVRATNDRTETGRINPNVRAEAAFNPESELIPVARANGITMIVTAPSGGLITGTSALMIMDGWTWEEMTFKAPAALNVNWPTMVISRAPRMRKTEEEQKKDREKAIQELADAFRDARAYLTAKKSEQQKGVPYHDVDMRWEAMIPVLEGKVPVVVWANEIQQIQAAVAWAEQEKVKLIIGGGADAWRIAEILSQKKIPVLVGGTHRLPFHRFDEYDDAFTLPVKLQMAGVQFAIISKDEAPHERNLPYHAATAAAYGLPKEEALKAITLYPAQIFGVADRVGSLEVGKDATLILTSGPEEFGAGDPLEITSQVDMEFIQGRKIDLTSRHTMLYEKYKEKYRRSKGQ